jgi:hypothetical protein
MGKLPLLFDTFLILWESKIPILGITFPLLIQIDVYFAFDKGFAK